MPVYEILPDSAINPAVCAVTGAASAAAALADASDGSYVVVDYGADAKFTMADPGAVTGRLCSIGAKVRAALNGMDASYAWIEAGDEYGSRSLRGMLLSASGSAFVDNEVLAHVGVNPDPATGSIDPKTLLIDVVEGNYNADDRAKVARAALELYYLPAVTVTSLTAPAGTVVTQRPTLTAKLALTVETWQLPSGLPTFLCGGDVQYQVFRSADAPGSTPPAGVTPVSSGSARFTEAAAGARTPSVSAACGASLENGTYVVFARASRDLMAGAGLTFSAWTKSAVWTVAVPAPNAPAVLAWPEDSAQRVGIQLTGTNASGYDASTALAEVQRLTATGWVDVRGIDAIPLALGSGQVVGYDYEAERAAVNTYRARISQVYLSDGLRKYSAWTQAAAAGPAAQGSNFKLLGDPAHNWLDAPVAQAPSEESQAESAVFVPLDRPFPVVVSGVVGGMRGSLSLTAKGADEIAALEALRDYCGVVLYEDAFGGAKYIRVTSLSWDRTGTACAPRRPAALSYTEVGCDLTGTPA